MILTGRTGLLALICVLPIALSPWPARAFVMLLVALAVAVTVDTLLAASTRKLRFTRSPYTSARLGQPVDASLLLCNGGRRRFRGQVRDAWPPSARAAAAHPRCRRGCRAAPAGAHRTAASSAWGPARSNGHGPFDRTTGVGGTAEFTVGARLGPGAAAVPVSQAPAVEAGQAAGDRRAVTHVDTRPRHRIRFAARVCRRRRRPLDRLARERTPRRCHGPHLAARTGPPSRHRARHRTHGGGAGRCRPDRRRSRRVAAAGLVHGCRTAVGGTGVTSRRPCRLPGPRPDQPRRRVWRLA